MTAEFLTPQRRKTIKSAVESAAPGWMMVQARKDSRLGVWNVSLRRPDEDEAPEGKTVLVVLGDAEMDGLVEGGPSGERAFAKVKKAVALQAGKNA